MSSLATVFRGCEEAERVLRDVGSLSRRSRDRGCENCGCVTGTSSCVPNVSSLSVGVVDESNWV